MSLTPFTRELGTTQGRIKPSRVLPDEGVYDFALGADAVGRKFTFADGDKVQIAQTASATGVVFLRPKVHIRPPVEPPPTGVSWIFEMVVNSVVVASIVIDRPRDLSDIAANVAPLDPGSFEVDFRLRVAGSGGPWELELPGVYIDSLASDTSAARPVLINRLPERGEVEVPRRSVIRLDISDSETHGINASLTNVYVDGVLAFNGSTFTAGWNGASSATSVLDAGQTLRIVIEPTADFASLSEVDVRVVTQTADAVALDQTYAFNIEDYTPPTLVSAQARDRSTVRVEFSEAVLASEALDPTRWTIDIVQGPQIAWGNYRVGGSVWVDVASVTAISDRIFDIATDIPMTMRATYLVSAGAIHDLFGNVADPLASSLDFLSVDTRPVERRFELVNQVPAMNIAEDATQDLRKVLWAWQEPIELMLCLVDEWLQLLDPDTAPEPFLDAMLQDLGNPFAFALTVTEKRRLIGLLVPIYQQKGTAEGIISTIRLFLGLTVTIAYPCFAGLGLGYAVLGTTFVLGGDIVDAYGYEIVSGIALTDDQRDKIRGIAEFMQATNEHLIGIVEPTNPNPTYDPVVLGISRLGIDWIMH